MLFESDSESASFFRTHPEFRTDTIMEFMPTIIELDEMLADLMPNLDSTPSMGVLDSVVPPPSAYPFSEGLKITKASSLEPERSTKVREGFETEGYDRYGYSAYARAVTALAQVFTRDRASAKSREGVEMLRHFAVAEVCAWDGVCVPETLGTDAKYKIFGERVKEFGVALETTLGDEEREEREREVLNLASLITRIEGVTAYVLLAGGGGEPWRRFVLDSLALPPAKPSSTPKPAASGKATPVPGATIGFSENVVPQGGVQKTVHAQMNALASLVLDVLGRAVQAEMDLKAAEKVGVTKAEAKALKNGVVVMGRVARRVFERVFDDDERMGSQDVDVWVGFARRVEKSGELFFVRLS